MRARTLLGLLVLAPLTASLASAAGCSADESPAASGSDASTDGAVDARPDAPTPEDSAPPRTCRELCELAHPTGRSKDEAIDSCWETHCVRPCIEQLPQDAGSSDGGASDAGACVSPVVTISESCDECTRAFCCASWDGCFQDPECAALNACYQDCIEP